MHFLCQNISWNSFFMTLTRTTHPAVLQPFTNCGVLRPGTKAAVALIACCACAYPVNAELEEFAFNFFKCDSFSKNLIKLYLNNNFSLPDRFLIIN